MRTTRESLNDWNAVMNACRDLIDKKMDSLSDKDGNVDSKEMTILLSCFGALAYTIIQSVAAALRKSDAGVMDIFFEAVRHYQEEEKGGAA